MTPRPLSFLLRYLHEWIAIITDSTSLVSLAASLLTAERVRASPQYASLRLSNLTLTEKNTHHTPYQIPDNLHRPGLRPPAQCDMASDTASLTTSSENKPPMTTAEVVAYVRKELDVDDEHLARVITASSVDLPRDAHSGVTLDLSHKNIKELPVEVVALIKDKVERLALSHNPQIAVPSQIIQCDRLRYLNLQCAHLFFVLFQRIGWWEFNRIFVKFELAQASHFSKSQREPCDLVPRYCQELE